MLEPLPKETVTPDRGKELTYHQKLSDQLKIEVYFPDPHAPWQRRTNENTNGLRKCFNWKTPYEVFYEKNVHLI